MAGYFSNFGEGDSPNAAAQFEREFVDNPDSFGGPGGGFLGRLIGARQPSSKITTTPLPDITPPGSNIFSAPVITRVVQGAMRSPPPAPPMPPQWSQGAPPAQNGPPMPPQWSQGAPPPQDAPPMPPQWSQGAPPPQNSPQMPPGGQQAAPMPQVPPGMPMSPLPPHGPQNGPQAQTPPGFFQRLFGGKQAASRSPGPQSLPLPYNPAHHPPGPMLMPGANAPAGGLSPDQAAQIADWYRQAQRGPGAPGNYAQGGYLRMMRGGYPADLMMGMPMRRDYARGNYVPSDGQGDGRSDHVEARLSPGEFVMDAESVSMLGNGDNAAGARKLEQLRRGVRSHKGKALAKGKFSPDAKKPEAYMRGKS